MSAAALEARHVSVVRGSARVVDGVSLEVCPGEVVALVGPNGAGKSSLLGALSSDLPLASGEVRIAGSSIEQLAPLECARLRAVMPQASVVAFPFTVDEVVRMGRSPWTRTPSADNDDDLVHEAMRSCDVAHLANRVFGSLSGGEQARAVLARTLAQDTPVLLLDEPTAALDLQHQSMVGAVLRDRADAGVAVIMVVHDLSFAAAYADRIAVLCEGSLVIDDRPERALTPDLLAKVYRQQVEVVRSPSGALVVVPIPARPQVVASDPALVDSPG